MLVRGAATPTVWIYCVLFSTAFRSLHCSIIRVFSP